MNTKQQEFDAVVAHLYKQGRPAKTEDDTCMYRAPGGLSCAVGCRIPDAIYVPEMDKSTDTKGTAVWTIVNRFSDVLPPEIGTYVSMFGELQGIHDGCPTNVDGTFRLDSLEHKLRNAAEIHGLTFTPPAV